MSYDWPFVGRLARTSLTQPRTAAAQILAMGAGARTALLAVGLAAVLSALLSALLDKIVPTPEAMQMSFLMSRPLLLAALQALGMIVFAALVTGIGRLLGGTGRMVQSLFLLAWFDVLLLALQVAMLLVVLALPVFGAILPVGVLGLVLWILAGFIAQLHGFASTARTLGGMVALTMLAGFALALLLPPQ